MSKLRNSNQHAASVEAGETRIDRALNQADTDKSWTEYIVERDGEIPLAFEGLLLGEGETFVSAVERIAGLGHFRKRGYEAKLYLTRSGKYVLGFRAWSQLSTELDRFKAVVAATPAELYDGLTELTGKGIPDAALVALRKAAVEDPRLRSIAVERI